MDIKYGLCVKCRGGKNLCGLTYCPLLVEYNVKLISKTLLKCSKEIYGSTPPSVFIGRVGYPYVDIGPATPPVVGDTSVYDLPELWLNYTLNDILSYRLTLIRGKCRVRVVDVENNIVLKLQELTLTLKPVDIEVYLTRIPKLRLVLDEHIPPMGPSSPMEKFKIIGSIRGDRRLEKAYYDYDLKARDAVILLYESGIPVSAIQRILSVGGLGKRGYRRLVPTRWSITAVDSIISDYLVSKVKEFQVISKYYVYVDYIMDNLFIVILAPRPWSFEWMEAWFPGSTWNPQGLKVEIEGDYEGYTGRTTYPEIGGCYYASRLAVAEALLKMKRQATAILWREIYSGFNIPVGVWFVRECLRRILRKKPTKFNSITSVLSYIAKFTRVNINTWIDRSYLVKTLLKQETISKYLK